MTNAEATKTAPAKGGGLAGMVVADSSISFVDGAQGILEYRGYDIRVAGREQYISKKWPIFCGTVTCRLLPSWKT